MAQMAFICQDLLAVFKIIKTSIFYCFSLGTESLIAAVLLVLLSRKIPPEDYGYWVLFVALFGFMRPVIGLMLQDVLRLKYFKYSKEELVTFIRTALSIPTLILGICLIVSYFFQSVIESVFSFPGDFFWSVVLMAYLHGLFLIFLALFQFREQHKNFMILQLIQTFFTIILTYYFLTLSLSWYSAVFARLIALTLCIVFAVAIFWNEFGNLFRIKIERNNFFKITKIGSSFIPLGLAPLLVPLSTRIIVTKISSTAETGYLGIGALFASVLQLIFVALIFAWQPKYFANQQAEIVENNDINSFKYFYFAALPFAAIIVILLGFYLGPYFTSYDMKFIKPYIVIMGVSALFEGYLFYNQSMLHAQSRLKEIALYSTMVVLICIILNYILGINFGSHGVAIGTALSYLIVFFISSLFIKKIETITVNPSSKTHNL